MTWQINPLVITFLISAALILWVIIISFRHISVRGARFFILLSISVEIWTLFMGLELAVLEPWAKMLFGKFQYLGISTIGISWLMFALSYNRKDRWLTPLNIFLLSIIPAITVVLTFTNELHGLIWSRIIPASDLPGANLIYVHGPAFWLIFIYIYINLAIGTFVIIDNALRARDVYRWQMLGLIVSGVIPWIGNAIYVANLSPIPGLDLTPLGFTLSASVIAFSVFYLGLFDLVPVARDQLVENLLDGVLILDTQGRVADINPKARELLGIGNERLVRRNVIDFLGPWPDLVERFRDVESAKTEVHFNGPEVTDVELRISPLSDEHGYLIGRLIVIRDISEQKKLEKLRDDLIHAMVHDLRNPLSSIVLSLDLLKSQLLPTLSKDQLIILETGENSTRRILGLVNSILDISRLENGQMPLKREHVLLQKMTAEVIQAQSLFAQKKRILLQKDVPDSLHPVMVDEELMRRVFQNLLDNAIKFSPDGGVVRIRAEYNANGREIIVSVRDGGAGIPEDVKSRLFQKFAPGNDKASGSGLGLAFCRLVVEAHKGRIWIDDKTEVGTAICVSIPLS